MRYLRGVKLNKENLTPRRK